MIFFFFKLIHMCQVKIHRAHNEELLCASMYKEFALWLHPKLATVKKERPDMYQHLVLQVGDKLCDKISQGEKTHTSRNPL